MLLNQRFDDEQYEYKLDFKDLKLAIDLLKSYIEENPNDADNGYWDNDTKKHLKRMRKNLKIFRKWWKKHSEVKVYFYDSY